MTLNRAIEHFRARHIGLFRDAGTLTRNIELPVWDPETGDITNGPVTIYDGPVSLRGFRWEGSNTVYGQEAVRIIRVRCHFPPDVDVRHGDTFTATESTHDEVMVGLPYRVTDPTIDGWQVTRFCVLEQITPESDRSI